jgi:hypothetical protein
MTGLILEGRDIAKPNQPLKHPAGDNSGDNRRISAQTFDQPPK